MKKWIAMILAIVMALSLCACGKDSTEPPKGTTGSSVGKQEDPTPTVTVLCLTQIVSSYNGEDYVCNVTYEEDGIHVTPEKLIDTYVSVYNADGNALYELRYNDEGINSYREDYTYNSEGQLTEWLDFDVEDNCKASRKLRSYNDRGQLVKEVYENRVSVSYSNEYTYDANGFLTEMCSYDGDGVMDERYEYVTNSEGQIQSCTGYRLITSDEPLRKWGVYTYSYDSAGRLLSKVWEQSINYPMSNISDYYTYDQNGNVTRWESGSHTANAYSYNEDGYLVSVTDTLSDYTSTCVYTEVELPEELAEMARKWSLDGIKNTYVPQPDI